MALGLPDVMGGVLAAAWIAYGVTGGADFGGGVWDLLARGQRAREQREAISEAIGPIWEANHVWLVFVIVLLFTSFPLAFSVAMTALHIPILLVLMGITARGSVFAFRKHDVQKDERFLRWSLIFGAASAVTPIFLGMTLAATATGDIRVDASGEVTSGFVAGWTHPFAVAVGVFAMILFAYLAAVYMTVDLEGRELLQEDFRLRALVTGIVLAPVAFGLLAWTRWAAPVLYAGLTGPVGLVVFIGGASGMGAVTLWALWRRRFRAARILAPLQAAIILAGWAWAQRPYLIVPDIGLAEAAAPDPVLALFLVGVGAGAIILVPSMWYLFRVFKGLGPGGDPKDT